MLELKTSFHSGVLNIELYGALDALTAPDFRHWLSEKSQTGYHNFAINCGGLEYISSRGIGVLSELNYVLNAQNNRLVLYHVSNEVLNLLEFLKLSEVIPIVESLEQAYGKFKDLSPKKNQVPPAARPTEPDKFVGVMAEPRSEMENEDELNQVNFQQQSNKSSVGIPGKTAEQNVPVNEEYIDLTNHTSVNTEFDISSMNVIFCPNCGQNLRVGKKGLYLCPDCRTKFNYPFQ